MDRPRIMMVEDEPVAAADLQFRLRAMNYDVCAKATSGEEAVIRAEKEKPDLVLMDIFLDGEMDGIEAATRIHGSHGTPVIFLTALSDDTLLDRAKAAEPYGYLVKPLETHELHSTIEMALYKARAEAEREKLTRDLQEALTQVKQLKGYLPICANCKKIRDDEGYWQQVEEYISVHTDALFTHSICLECEHDLYPELHEPPEAGEK